EGLPCLPKTNMANLRAPHSKPTSASFRGETEESAVVCHHQEVDMEPDKLNRWLRRIALILCLGSYAFAANAEQSELRVAKQYGLGYLQMMVMEDQKIVEKNGKAAGLGDIKVTWATFRSSDVMNDALLSGNVDFVCLGIPGIATIWAKTQGGLEVKAASGFNFLPLQLNTRNPDIKSIRDLTE